jgi:CcmD family protein
MRKFSWILMLLTLSTFAQTPMDDLFYSSGKIYVVIAVLLIIFSGITFYLIRLDRKISKLENKDEA